MPQYPFSKVDNEVKRYLQKLNEEFSLLGNVEISTPRDRNGTFEPEIVGKRQRTQGVDIDRQILALYARGSSFGDIGDHLHEMYGVDVSPATISRVTDKILPLVQEWKSRPLEAVYPFVWLG